MIKYFLGRIKNIFNPALSCFVRIDAHSRVSKKARINKGVKILESSVGDYSYIGNNTTVVHAAIGKFCSIASECHIGMATHTIDFLSTSPVFTESHNGVGCRWVKESIVEPYKKVEVGNDVWIGLRALILGGVHVGNGAVVAAGSIVTKDVPPYSIVAGVPAKVVRYRFPNEDIRDLELLRWWDLSEDILKDNVLLFQGKPDLDLVRSTFG